ncbi:FAD-dependent monooxygenase [Allokutzneria sp. A3M-2-11 16]|uniref:FAD-dependent oxidoreductase n=1 Tax=Allokutzneria sp. A3M-2-11 16 TaxID=2962043 RepID=UPI0020B68CC4|nr:FAD-dependent oxidoreductase [Allokutzneria sp. A3M-2-11 16]MCP3804931.1 FAD-dependent monooxygenase [Allokutzneria sp. A3M-2-11 16]
MRVVICGAGIAGLALAVRLSTSGDDVVVLERAPGPRAQGYMIDFFGSGYAAAERMGLLPRLHELGYRVPRASYVDEDGRVRASLGFRRFAKAVNGGLVSIMRPDLELALREAFQAELRFGTTITSVDNRADGVTVELSDGTTMEADLLVGADGIHSSVREMIFGEEREFLRYLGFHTAAYTFDDAEVRAAVEGGFCLTDTVDRQMGLYALRDGRVAVFTVHRTADPTRPENPTAAVRQAYGSMGWLVPRALAKAPEEIYYDQVAQIEIPRWSEGRVVLIGDACHAVSLLAGQGASLGLAGGSLLADELHARPTIAEALAGYERRWRPVVEEKQRVARSGTRWFLPDSRPRLWARRVALKLARLPLVDRAMATALVGKL